MQCCWSLCASCLARCLQALCTLSSNQGGGAGGRPAVRATRGEHGGLPRAGRAVPHGRVLAARCVARFPPIAPQRVAARGGGRGALLRARAGLSRGRAAVAAAGALAAAASRTSVTLSAAWGPMSGLPAILAGGQAAPANGTLSGAWGPCHGCPQCCRGPGRISSILCGNCIVGRVGAHVCGGKSAYHARLCMGAHAAAPSRSENLRTCGHGVRDHACAHVVASRPQLVLRRNQPSPWVWRNYPRARPAMVPHAGCWGMLCRKHACCLAHALIFAGVTALLPPRWPGRITKTRHSW